MYMYIYIHTCMHICIDMYIADPTCNSLGQCSTWYGAYDATYTNMSSGYGRVPKMCSGTLPVGGAATRNRHLIASLAPCLTPFLSPHIIPSGGV